MQEWFLIISWFSLVNSNGAIEIQPQSFRSEAACTKALEEKVKELKSKPKDERLYVFACRGFGWPSVSFRI